jgi:GNAT superfamily N-acetyltransferase
MTITIRLATVADAAEAARLSAAANEHSCSPAKMAAQLERCAGIETFYLAEVDGQAVGYACLRFVPTICGPADPWAELTELYVEEAYRRHGVGRVLIERVEAEARSRGASELFLLTGFKKTRAHHFYHAVGYSLQCFAMKKVFNG